MSHAPIRTLNLVKLGTCLILNVFLLWVDKQKLIFMQQLEEKLLNYSLTHIESRKYHILLLKRITIYAISRSVQVVSAIEAEVSNETTNIWRRVANFTKVVLFVPCALFPFTACARLRTTYFD